MEPKYIGNMNINKCFTIYIFKYLVKCLEISVQLFKRSWADKLFIKNQRNGKRSEFKGAGIAVNN